MLDLKRVSTTVLGIGVLFLSASGAIGAPSPAPQLVVTSATRDATNNRLVIRGVNFSWPPTPASGRVTPPLVTLDLLPLTVLSASATEVVAWVSGTFPEGTYLLTVSRGPSATDSDAFAVAIYNEQPPQIIAGPSGPAGPVGATGPAGPEGAIGPAGPAGPVGVTGLTGAGGSVGAAGPVGAVGPIGSAGPIGPAGPVGATGLTGPVGPIGPAGAPGAIGPQGLPGVSGYQVLTGTASNTNLGGGKLINAKALCPAGTRVLTGGVQQTTAPTFGVSMTLVSSYPDTPQSWFAEFRNNETFSIGAVAIVVYAICATVN
jgi:Collagen triple helix repeat (20 copies)